MNILRRPRGIESDLQAHEKDLQSWFNSRAIKQSRRVRILWTSSSFFKIVYLTNLV